MALNGTDPKTEVESENIKAERTSDLSEKANGKGSGSAVAEGKWNSPHFHRLCALGEIDQLKQEQENDHNLLYLKDELMQAGTGRWKPSRKKKRLHKKANKEWRALHCNVDHTAYISRRWHGEYASR